MGRKVEEEEINKAFNTKVPEGMMMDMKNYRCYKPYGPYGSYLFGIADLTRPQLPKCNNHLVTFIKVDGLSVPYIVDIFDTIKSRTMVYRSTSYAL